MIFITPNEIGQCRERNQDQHVKFEYRTLYNIISIILTFTLH